MDTSPLNEWHTGLEGISPHGAESSFEAPGLSPYHGISSTSSDVCYDAHAFSYCHDRVPTTPRARVPVAQRTAKAENTENHRSFPPPRLPPFAREPKLSRRSRIAREWTTGVGIGPCELNSLQP